MAQTPAKFVHDGKAIDYTPTDAVIAGQVVELGTVPLVAPVAIPAGVLGALSCDGVFDVPKTADAFNAGDTVYWDDDGNPVTGEAGSGAADSETGNLMGVAVADAAAEASYVRVRLHAIKRMATLVTNDPITTTGITGSDASLGIAGIAGDAGDGGAAGGAVAIAGGKGDTNKAGGAASLTGGAGNGTGAGGASSVVGGAGGATGTGGAIAITGGAGGSTSGNGGAITIAGGAGTAGNSTGGAVNITGGALHGTGANGAVNIAADKACAVTIGYADGTLKLVGIPTTDPKVKDQVWASSNVLTLSEGEGGG
jgi:predicted RecA/RadA family phage recombinase